MEKIHISRRKLLGHNFLQILTLNSVIHLGILLTYSIPGSDSCFNLIKYKTLDGVLGADTRL